MRTKIGSFILAIESEINKKENNGKDNNLKEIIKITKNKST